MYYINFICLFDTCYNNKRAELSSKDLEQIIIIYYIIHSNTQMSDSIDNILQLPQRKIIVSENDVFLDKKNRNDIFILMVEESVGSAGGRAAGFGHRRVERIYGFSCYESGECTKFFDTTEQNEIDRFDIPYSAVAMDIRLSDGKPYTLQGIVDPNSVATYHSVVGNLK
jgi:hypothetical protein